MIDLKGTNVTDLSLTEENTSISGVTAIEYSSSLSSPPYLRLTAVCGSVDLTFKCESENKYGGQFMTIRQKTFINDNNEACYTVELLDNEGNLAEDVGYVYVSVSSENPSLSGIVLTFDELTEIAENLNLKGEETEDVEEEG